MNRKIVMCLLIGVGILIFLGLTTLLTWMDLHYYVALHEGVYERVWLEKTAFILSVVGITALVVIIVLVGTVTLGVKLTIRVGK